MQKRLLYIDLRGAHISIHMQASLPGCPFLLNNDAVGRYLLFE